MNTHLANRSSLLAIASLFASLLCSGARAQSARAPTKDQIIKKTEDVSLRLKILPQGELALRGELAWVANEEQNLSPILSMDDNLADEEKQLQHSRQAIADLFNYLPQFKCGSGSDQVLRTRIMQATGPLNQMGFEADLENTPEYLLALQFTQDNADFIAGKVTAVTACQKLLENIQSNQSLQSQLLALHTLVEKNIRDRQEAIKSKKVAALIYEQHLKDYRQKLTADLEKATTQLSLQENLWLMILVIGGLSVLAILVVRLFPETVMMEWVTSGQVIQFVTVMILLSAIMALGLSGLIKENTLGTLLGGVAGYVLSQGVGKVIQKAALSPSPTTSSPPPHLPPDGPVIPS